MSRIVMVLNIPSKTNLDIHIHPDVYVRGSYKNFTFVGSFSLYCIRVVFCIIFKSFIFIFNRIKKKTNIKVGAYHRRVLNEDDNLKKKRPYIYFERLHGYGWLIQAWTHAIWYWPPFIILWKFGAHLHAPRISVCVCIHKLVDLFIKLYAIWQYILLTCPSLNRHCL